MKYRYTGPASGVTLADGQEILLWPAQVTELPADHEYVKTLIALGYLLPVADQVLVDSATEVTLGR
ncbi:hypothetical protein [Pectobacterium brasiliense]|uniref:hypothetical protein n=1 Tax=Pectobacterium brasiliense TaxID=180957 RepID=UPI000C1BA757|nr:hypothetical protein [Pectobacterium brasiliense]ATV43122.1 hypothetical protein CTV95_06475 [Pectobacterium brasiliense]MCA6982569.1 hypothetical protein [Pectobacterium brasiliense]MCH4992126.1 hypothetical protein [Pectobacterium brasiliense]